MATKNHLRLGFGADGFPVVVLEVLSSLPLSEEQQLLLGPHQLSRPWGRRHPLGGQLRCWGHWEQPPPCLPTRSRWPHGSTPSQTHTRESPAGHHCSAGRAPPEHKAPIHSSFQVPPRLPRRTIS